MIKNIFFGVILMSSYMFSSALYKYEELELENGLKIVAIPMNNNSSVIDINVFYKVGSRNEIMGKSGIAHMLEHMNFKSTKNLKSGEFDNIVKRFYDIILSIILLPLLLIIFFIIALFIKLTSKGPVFYGHNRVGRYGKTIKVLKFRSMYQDADVRLKEILENNIEAKKEWETYYKLKDDPRVTPIGKFLRKTSLDELPQIFNVIKGDMSFVGPRPVIQDEIDKYYKELASYYYMVRPGITGLWQISGRNDIDYDTRVAKDSWYVLNWSVWLDIVILFKTPGAVLQKKGAY